MIAGRGGARAGAWCIGAAALLSILVACSPERLRPGPPTVALEFPGGSTTDSPDTVGVRIVATDPNGLDTVSVAFREVVITLNALARTEFDDLVFLPIPADLENGAVLSIIGTAADLSGQLAQTTGFLTVVRNAPSP